MRYLAALSDYLNWTHDNPDWIYIYDLLMRIDSYNDCISLLESREKISNDTGIALTTLTWFFPCYPRWLDYRHLGWLECMVRSFKSELKSKYGISVDEIGESYDEPEEEIEDQISLEDYIYSLNPVFRISRPDLIWVHP